MVLEEGEVTDLNSSAMILYKYTQIGPNLDDSLVNHRLYFNNPQNFNDPFDCNFILDTDCSEQEKKNYIRINMQAKSHSPDEIDIAINRALSDHDSWNALIQTAKTNFLNRIEVCCFSKTDKNPLLWAHYSAKHTGICLVFDTSLDDVFFDKTYSVKYRSNYPRINFIRDRIRFNELILTKSIDWIYEQEVRVIKDSGKKLYHFSKKSLVGIVFGCKIKEEEVNRIKVLLTQNDYNIFVKKAMLRNGSFGIDFQDI